MDPDDFHRRTRTDWDAAIASIFGGSIPPATAVWRNGDAIMQVLARFMGHNRNHAHYPTGGGLSFLAVAPSADPGCLEFKTTDHSVDVMKPRSLTLERIDAAGQSFLLLELDNLDPSGVYDRKDETAKQREHPEQIREELVEVAPGDYRNREVWDRGYLDLDDNGDEIPIPDEARLTVRWLKGNVLLVAKGSLWNGLPATYDGRHNKMTADEIRRFIESLLASSHR